MPLAVLTALVNDPIAADAVREAMSARRRSWVAAAREGLADPELRRVPAGCFDAALCALPRLGADPTLITLVTALRERFVARGRCLADDFLDDPLAPHDRRILTTVEPA